MANRHQAKFLTALLCCSAVFLQGCATTAALPAGSAQPDVALAEYRVAPGDKLQISTFGEVALSPQVDVGPDGMISLPLVGDVQASGLTTAGLSDALMARYGAGYLKQPKITVQVLNYRPFSVLGEVNKPGQYPYAVGMTVQSAVAAAQGYTYRAETKRAFIKRMGEAQEQEVSLTAATPVNPGDTIRVGERYF